MGKQQSSNNGSKCILCEYTCVQRESRFTKSKSKEENEIKYYNKRESHLLIWRDDCNTRPYNIYAAAAVSPHPICKVLDLAKRKQSHTNPLLYNRAHAKVQRGSLNEG